MCVKSHTNTLSSCPFAFNFKPIPTCYPLVASPLDERYSDPKAVFRTSPTGFAPPLDQRDIRLPPQLLQRLRPRRISRGTACKRFSTRFDSVRPCVPERLQRPKIVSAMRHPPVPCQGRSRRCSGETASDLRRCAGKRRDGTATTLRASRAELAVPQGAAMRVGTSLRRRSCAGRSYPSHSTSRSPLTRWERGARRGQAAPIQPQAGCGLVAY